MTEAKMKSSWLIQLWCQCLLSLTFCLLGVFLSEMQPDQRPTWKDLDNMTDCDVMYGFRKIGLWEHLAAFCVVCLYVFTNKNNHVCCQLCKWWSMLHRFRIICLSPKFRVYIKQYRCHPLTSHCGFSRVRHPFVSSLIYLWHFNVLCRINVLLFLNRQAIKGHVMSSWCCIMSTLWVVNGILQGHSVIGPDTSWSCHALAHRPTFQAGPVWKA